MTDVVIRNQQTGVVGTVPQEQADRLLLQGSATGDTYEPVSAEDLADIQRQNYSESALGQAEAAARGSVDWAGELPIGLAARAMGVEGPAPSLSAILEGAASEAMGASPLEAGNLIASEAEVGRRLEEQAGGAYMAGEILGQVAALGVGRGVAGLGSLGEAAAARAGFGRVAGLVAQSAGEGAIQGAGAALMADPQRSAQSVIADAGLGALIGGAAGGALPLAGAGIAAGGRKVAGAAGKLTKRAGEALDAMRPRTAEELADGMNRRGVTGQLHDAYAESTAALLNIEPQVVRDYGLGGHLSEVGEQSARNLPQIVENETRTAAGKLRGISSDVDDVLDEFRASPAKAEHIRANTPEEILNDQARIAAGAGVARDTLAVIQSIRDEAAALKAGGFRFSKAGLDAVENTVRMAEQMAESGAKLDTTADAFALGDRIKRAGDRSTKSLRESALAPGNMNDFERTKLREFADQIFQANNGLRKSLESTEIYGEYAGTMQREINAAYSVKDEMGMSGVDALDAFRDTLMTSTGRTDFATGRRIYEIDPAKLKSVFAGLGTVDRELAERNLKAYVERASEAMKVHARAGEYLGEAFTAKAARAAQGLDDLAKQIDALETTQLHASNWNTLKRGASDTFGGALVAAGTLAGGPVGFVLGLAASAVANPARAASVANGMAAAARRSGAAKTGFRQWIATGARRAAEVGKEIAGGVTAEGRRAARVTGRAARPAIRSAAVRAFLGPRAMSDERPSPRDRYQEQMRLLERYNPGLVADGLMRDGSVPAPVAQAIAAKGAEVAAYCLARAPSAKYGGAVRPGMPYQPSDMELDAYARVWGAAHHPRTALDDIQNGTATPQQVATVRDLYPDVYAGWQSAAMEGLMEADQDGVPVPMGQRAYLAAVLDLDGAGDPFLTDSFAASMRGYMGAAQEQQANAGAAQPPPSSPPGIQSQTPAQGMMAMV